MPEADINNPPPPDPSRESRSDCGNAAVRHRIAQYCFGDVDDQQRLEIEAHLLECDICWQEVQKLDASVRALRSNRSLMRTVLTPGALGALGLSGRVDRPLGGHHWHVLGSSLVYALLFAVSLVFEVAYQFDTYGFRTVLAATLGVLPWMWTTTLGAMAADWRLSRVGRRNGLALSLAISTLAVMVLLAGIWQILPNHPITLSRIQAYPAQAAYSKNTLYHVPLGFVFLLIPFHFVLALQTELREGRHRRVFALLAGEKTGFAPRGAVFLRVWQLALVLAGAGLASLYLTTNLMDNLKPAPYMNLFVNLIQIRIFFYFGLAVGCLVWYSRALDEIKRECVAVMNVPPR